MQMSPRGAIRRFAKDISIKTGLCRNLFFSNYPYMYQPNQLVVLTQCISAVRNVPGCFVEAGCAYGATSVFLNKFMSNESIERDYFAFDTFSGFVREHVDHEIKNRGKSDFLRDVFSDNKKSWFDQTMRLNNLNRVKSFQQDVTKFDFSTIAPIAFCLLDLDLYEPTKYALRKIYDAMSPGGIVVIDDCQADTPWDGAYQAYEEFLIENDLPKKITAVKLGIIRIPQSQSSERRKSFSSASM
jgi:O-methyltransferase